MCKIKFSYCFFERITPIGFPVQTRSPSFTDQVAGVVFTSTHSERSFPLKSDFHWGTSPAVSGRSRAAKTSDFIVMRCPRVSPLLPRQVEQQFHRSLPKNRGLDLRWRRNATQRLPHRLPSTLRPSTPNHRKPAAINLIPELQAVSSGSPNRNLLIHFFTSSRFICPNLHLHS